MESFCLKILLFYTTLFYILYTSLPPDGQSKVIVSLVQLFSTRDLFLRTRFTHFLLYTPLFLKIAAYLII